jgi:hypothetical protein
MRVHEHSHRLRPLSSRTRYRLTNDSRSLGQSFVVVGKIVYQNGRFGAHHLDCYPPQLRRSTAPMLGIVDIACEHVMDSSVW